MTEEQTPAQTEPKELDPQRVAAFLCDSRAPDLLLEQTLKALIASQKLEHVLVDVDSVAGRAIAHACQKAGVEYTVLDFAGAMGPQDEDVESETAISADPADEEKTTLCSNAVQVVDMDPAQIGMLRAQLCIVPAASGQGLAHLDAYIDAVKLDLSPTTIPGLTFLQARDTGRSLLLIDIPERGLIREEDSTLRRRLLHIGAKTVDMPQTTDEQIEESEA